MSVAASVAAVSVGLAAATPAFASGVLGQLDPGEMLNIGQSLSSPDGRYVLTMQTDGNLVEYAPGHKAVAETHTAGNPGAVVFQQSDGNLVLRAPGNRPIWATGTADHPGTVLQVQDDGAMVEYSPGHKVLRVLRPALEKSSVATPRPGLPIVAPGVDKSKVGDFVYDGTRAVGCSALGKAIPPPYGAGADVFCGMVTDSSGAELDGYGLFVVVGCAALGLPLGPACSILLDAEPVG